MSQSPLYNYEHDWANNPNATNSLFAIYDYFDTSDQPMRIQDFYEFWNTLSKEEKEEYRRTRLT